MRAAHRCRGTRRRRGGQDRARPPPRTRSRAQPGRTTPPSTRRSTRWPRPPRSYDELLYDRYDEVTPFEIPGRRLAPAGVRGPRGAGGAQRADPPRLRVVEPRPAARPGPAARRATDGRRGGGTATVRRGARRRCSASTNRTRSPRGTRSSVWRRATPRSGCCRGRARRARGVAGGAVRPGGPAAGGLPLRRQRGLRRRLDGRSTRGLDRHADAARCRRHGRPRRRRDVASGRAAAVPRGRAVPSRRRCQPRRHRRQRAAARRARPAGPRHGLRQRLLRALHHRQVPLAAAERGVHPRAGQQLRPRPRAATTTTAGQRIPAAWCAVTAQPCRTVAATRSAAPATGPPAQSSRRPVGVGADHRARHRRPGRRHVDDPVARVEAAEPAGAGVEPFLERRVERAGADRAAVRPR